MRTEQTIIVRTKQINEDEDTKTKRHLRTKQFMKTDQNLFVRTKQIQE